MRLTRKKRIQEVEELNITAFLNLMVILVPFLLITAVFSRITILQLNLPHKDAVAVQQQKIELQLELVVREDSFEIRDSNLGRIRYLTRNKLKPNWKAFTNILMEIKNRFPDETNITLLLAPGVKYKTLIQVMDRVRSTEVVLITEVETVELFPDVSIGDAPQEETQLDNTGEFNSAEPESTSS